MTIRAGAVADAEAVARLHVTEINEGFLSGLGTGFLVLLYRRIVRHPGSFLLVADDGGAVTGFAAGTEDLARLYRTFMWRDGVRAVARSASLLAGCWHRVRETMRYPGAGESFPGGELVAVAVAGREQGRGTGKALVGEIQREFARRGVVSAKVTTARDNAAALGLYRACGFRPSSAIEVHRGTPSVTLVWP